MHILKESKVRLKNVTMAWIDSKKNYDMFLCPKMNQISKKVMKLITETIKQNEKRNWQYEENF